jgi:hypothetical protein
MNSDPGDFEALRKLMALKRHEQPPPGYFNRLPDKIMGRLERGDGQPRFWENFLTVFTFRPALAYGFALAAFSALTLSVIYSVKTSLRESPRIRLTMVGGTVRPMRPSPGNSMDPSRCTWPTGWATPRRVTPSQSYHRYLTPVRRIIPSPSPSTSPAPKIGRPHSFGVSNRQRDGDGRPAPEARQNANFSTMGFHHPAHDGQSQSRAFMLGGPQ